MTSMAATDPSAVDSEAYRKRIEADLRVAERVHRSMIPRSERRGSLEIACRFTPMLGIGGDYASVFFQTDTRVVASICDVAGHGIAAALLASRVNSFVLNMAPRAEHPCEIGDALNAFICDKFKDAGLFLTFFCLFLDLDSQSLLYSGFGHPPVLLYSKRNAAITQINSENTMIGIERDMTQNCSMLRVPFEPGDRLIMYTDGLTEASNAADEFLNVEGLKRLFQDTVHLSMEDGVADIFDRIDIFCDGAPAADDQLLLALGFLDGDATGSDGVHSAPGGR
jgi:sigma-B regulation protein RsbU (phosphoserine phosphatase)